MGVPGIPELLPFIDKLSNLRELITDITDQLGGKHGGWETIAVH